MAAPEGYVALDLVGFTDKGDYSAETNYAANDIVHSENRMFLSLQDNNEGQALPVLPETENTWWQLWLSGGADDLGAITAKDTSNVTGGGAGQLVVAQTLIDAIASKVMNDLIANNAIDNNLLGTDPTHVLASPQGKKLADQITQLNSNLRSQSISVRCMWSGGYGENTYYTSISFPIKISDVTVKNIRVDGVDVATTGIGVSARTERSITIRAVFQEGGRSIPCAVGTADIEVKYAV